MDNRRLGLLFRAVRWHLGLTQAAVARAANVSQSIVSRIERGLVEGMSIEMIERVGRVLDIRVRLDAWWRGGDADRLLDSAHAAIVNSVVSILRAAGWQIVVEYTFSEGRDRGSVDILAWHAATRTLLLIEVKSRLMDLQELFATFARKRRVVPRLVAAELGWVPAAVGSLIVVPGSRQSRSIVRAHAAMFDVNYPARTADVTRWIRQPQNHLAGVWFVPPQVVPRSRRRR